MLCANRTVLGFVLTVVLFASNVQASGSITITSPAIDAVIPMGTMPVTVQITDMPTVARVEYYIFDQLRSLATMPPYNVSFLVGLDLFDGEKQLYAVAKDADGSVLATSAPVRFTTNITGQRLIFGFTDEPESGSVLWNISMTHASVFYCSIDGISGGMVQHYFSSADVDPVSDTIRIVNHGLSNKKLIYFIAADYRNLPAGIGLSSPTYAIIVDKNTFKIAASPQNAQSGIAIDIKSSGNGTLIAEWVDNPLFGNPPGATGEFSYGLRVFTSRLPNGPHLFYCSAWTAPFWRNNDTSTMNPAWSFDFATPMAETGLTRIIDNGNAPIELRSLWQDIFLQVGESTALSPSYFHADSTRSVPAGVTFQSANTSIAIVDSSGVVQGISPGATTVNFGAGNMVGSTRVTVRTAKIFPHLTRSGRILTSYLPNTSLFLREMFNTDPGWVMASDKDPNGGSELVRAGINAVEAGLPNALVHAAVNDYDTFINYGVGFGWNSRWDMTKALVQPHGLFLFFTGEAWAKDPADAHRIWSTPWRVQGAAKVLADCRDAGICIGADLVDEVNAIWGNDPNTNGRIGASNPFTSITVTGCPLVPCNGQAAVQFSNAQTQNGNYVRIAGSREANMNTYYLVNNYSSSGFVLTVQDVPNGVYDASTDPALEIVTQGGIFGYRSAITAGQGLSILVNSNIGTVTWPNHNATLGQGIRISGSGTTGLNDIYTVASVLNASTFTMVLHRTVPDGIYAAGLTGQLVSYPPFENNFVYDFVRDVFKQVPGSLAISWPMIMGGIGGWNNDPGVADYGSFYNTYTSNPSMSKGHSLAESLIRMSGPAIQYPHLRNPSLPAIQEVSASGEDYIHYSTSPYFVPFIDKMAIVGESPSGLQAMTLMAAESGMAGVRVYQYQWKDAYTLGARASGTPGREYQTGTNYETVDRWKALSIAFNFIKDYEAYILQPNIHAPALGPAIFAGAKEGNGARLLMATSFSELPVTVDINFTPYSYGGPITRSRLTAMSVHRTAIPTVSGERITLAPGETVAYLFTPRTSGTIQRKLSLEFEGTSVKTASGTLTFLDATSRITLATYSMTTNATGEHVFDVPANLPPQVFLRISIPGYLTNVLPQADMISAGVLELRFPQLSAGDFNGDGTVNSLDWSTMNRNWFGAHALADINRDGTVNAIDFSYLSKNWLRRGE